VSYLEEKKEMQRKLKTYYVTMLYCWNKSNK